MGILEGLLYMMWRGIAIGVIISAPMGPVGILCIQRTLEKGRRAGLYTGIGAAVSDLLYCLLTGFGLSFIQEFLERNQNIIQLIGSAVLIAFGIYLFRSNPSRKLRKPDADRGSERMNILNGFLFTFSNPLIIFLIIGLFARFNFMLPEITFYHYITGFIFIFVGALIWWYLVTLFVEKVRAHFNLRSMWLINKIIGSVILIFALVGIVTGIAGLAHAAARAPEPRAAISRQSEPQGDEIAVGSEDFELSFRCRNHANNPVTGRMSPWRIVLVTDNGRFGITVRTDAAILGHDTERATLRVSAPGCGESAVAEGADLYKGENAFRLSCASGRFRLEGGNREYLTLLEGELPSAKVDTVCLEGERIEICDVAFARHAAAAEIPVSHFGNPDVLTTHLLRTRDKREGLWRVYDRTLDEDLLRLGGDYTLAMIAGDSEGSYDLVYLSGARNNSGIWIPGMIKAGLTPTGFDGVYDVAWRDAAGEVLSKDVKGEYADGILTITFPYQNSVLRLRRLSPEAARRELQRITGASTGR